MLVLKI